MTQRSLHTVTKVYHRSMSCFATVSPTGPTCSAKVSPIGPSCTMWAWAKSQAISHSSEQDTQPIVFLISKQAAPYQKRGGTCCPGVSTPKIQSLVDLSTTCHVSINHLHHSNHCSNHLGQWNHNHPNRIVSRLSPQQTHDKIHGNLFPLPLRYLQRLQQSHRSLMLVFDSLKSVSKSNILGSVSLHTVPPISGLEIWYVLFPPR
jgi:hypothetical protein